MEQSSGDSRTITDDSAGDQEEEVAVSEEASGPEAPGREEAEEAPARGEEEPQPFTPAQDVPAGEGEAETAAVGVSELSVEDEPLPEETAEPAVSDEAPVEEESGAEAVAGHGGPLSQSADVRETDLAVEVPSEEVASALPEMDLP